MCCKEEEEEGEEEEGGGGGGGGGGEKNVRVSVGVLHQLDSLVKIMFL